jgi:hypothetical protein
MEGIEVGAADPGPDPDRLMRPVVGTAGPDHQLKSGFMYLQCHAVVSCILDNGWWSRTLLS